MGNKNLRLIELTNVVKQNNGVSIKCLSDKLNVSEMTIRRDLDSLKMDSIINVINGVVMYNEETPEENAQDYFIIQQRGVRNDEKDKIAQAAAALVEPDDSIIIDIGTTTSRVLSHLPSDMPITVLCFTKNSLLEALQKNFSHLIFGGGYYHADTEMFESEENCKLIRRTRATKAFISAAGVSDTLGLTCVKEYEVNAKKNCILSAQTKILLVDSVKLGRVRPNYFTSLQDIDIIITDDQISQEWIDILKELHIKLIIA